MAQRPTVTQMSRKFKSHAFTLTHLLPASPESHLIGGCTAGMRADSIAPYPKKSGYYICSIMSLMLARGTSCIVGKSTSPRYSCTAGAVVQHLLKIFRKEKTVASKLIWFKISLPKGPALKETFFLSSGRLYGKSSSKA